LSSFLIRSRRANTYREASHVRCPPRGHPAPPRAGCAPVPRPFTSERLEQRFLLAVFTVTTTADADPGSLRQAIVEANASPGADEIRFAIPGAVGAVRVIRPATPLPPARPEAVVIDATTQPGYAGAPLVEVDGSLAGAAADGLVVGSDAVVRGLAVACFGRYGVVLSGAFGRVEACYVGVTAAGEPAGNLAAGVRVEGQSCVVGGQAPSHRNVISGNGRAGVWIAGTADGTAVRGNFIGTTPRGDAALGNAAEGVLIDAEATGVVIGGSNPDLREGNLISGNGASGVHVAAGASATLLGNRIGTDAFGARAVPNGWSPLQLRHAGVSATNPSGLQIGGPTRGARNLLSGNAGSGVYVTFIEGSPLLQGNYVGTDATGGTRIANGGDGIGLAFLGSSIRPGCMVSGNLVSGNTGNGISARSVSMVAGGNYVGTNAAGTAPLGNGGDGIRLDNVQATIGKADTKPRPAPSTIDPASTTRNIISANGGNGIHGVPGYGTFENNFIGVDANGSVGIGNGANGLLLERGLPWVGPRVEGTGANVISANRGHGVVIVGVGSGHPGGIYGNRIGTDADGNRSNGALGNAGHGVLVSNSATIRIGSSSRGNTIAFNGGSGVAVEAGDGPASNTRSVTISGNSIFSNGRLGIDLVSPADGATGVTPNDGPADADTGPNGLQNFPVIQAAEQVEGGTRVTFTLAGGTPETRVEFFASPVPDPSGFGEGQLFLGSVAWSSVTSTVTLPRAPDGWYVTATTAGVSEFSFAFRIGAANVVNRRVFYNNSVADGGDPAADARDDAAIAADKTARTDVLGTLNNITSYPKGLNGVMVDIARLPAGEGPRQSDFVFHARGAQGWVPGPTPVGVTVRRGAGVNGSDRVTLVWADADDPLAPAGSRAVSNGWLQITVKANERTGLTRDDTFSFGNLVGETFFFQTPGMTAFRVDDRDFFTTRNGVRGIDRDRLDHDRDGVIDLDDVRATRANIGRALTLLPGSAAVADAGGGPAAPPRADWMPQRRRSQWEELSAVPG
jgi:hypothetical protein